MVIKSLFAQWFAVIYVAAVSFGVTTLLARGLGPANYGQYATALAGGSILAIVLDGGMRTLILRERSRATVKLERHVRNLVPFSVGHSIMASFLFLALSIFFLSGSRLWLACSTIVCFWGIVLTQYASAALRGDGKIEVDARFQVGARTFSALAIGGVLLAGFAAPWKILAAWSVVSVTYAAIVFLSYDVRPNFRVPFEIYKAAFPLFLVDLAITSYLRSDLLVLDYFRVSNTQIGQYSAAFRICDAYVMMSGPIGLLFFRHFRVVGKPLHQLRKDIFLYLGLFFLAGAVLAIGVRYFSADIIRLVYGVKYPDGGLYLGILAWMLFFIMPNMLLNQVSLALGRERCLMFIMLTVAVINIGVNFFLIPKYGILAAVWMTVVTEALVFLFILLFVIVFSGGESLAEATRS